MEELIPRCAVRRMKARLQDGSTDARAALAAGRRGLRLPAAAARSRTVAAVLGLAALLAAAALPARGARPRVYAITDARIVVAPGRVVEKGTVVIREGTIVEAGADARAPGDAELVDGRGMTVYAGLIDPFTHLGMPKRAEGAAAGRAGEKAEPAERGPGRPNVQVRSDVKGALLYQAPSREELEKLHATGFTSALVVPEGGALRGTSALVHLGGDDPARAILAADVAAHLSFETAEENVYPNSLMGVMALIRQTFEDAKRQALWEERWRKDPKGLERPPVAPALDAVEDILRGKRAVFEADDTHAFPRVVSLAGEFSLRPIVVGSGFEYEILEEVKKSGLPLIVPVAFPEAPHVEDADAALGVRLKDLRRWELAPGNPALLEKARIPFAITAWRLRSVSEFRKNVRRAVEAGLSKDAALEAVTIGPARLLGVDAVLGTVEKGKIADLVIADGDLFDEKTAVRRLFIDGEPVEVEQESRDFDPDAKIDPRGTWEVIYSFRGETLTRTWKIEGTPGALAGTAEIQSGTVPLSSLSLVGNKLTGSYAAGGTTVEFTWIIKGEQFSGTSVPSGGDRFSYSGRRTGKPGGGGQ